MPVDSVRFPVFPTVPPVRHPRALMSLALALEPRFLFDAAGAKTAADTVQPDATVAHKATAATDAALLDAAAQTPAAVDSGTAAKAGTIETPTTAATGVVPATATGTGAPAVTAVTGPAAAAAATAPREVAFIDTSLPNWQTLAADVHAGVEAVLLRQGSDAVQQMADFLNGQTG